MKRIIYLNFQMEWYFNFLKGNWWCYILKNASSICFCGFNHGGMYLYISASFIWVLYMLLITHCVQPWSFIFLFIVSYLSVGYAWRDIVFLCQRLFFFNDKKSMNAWNLFSFHCILCGNTSKTRITVCYCTIFSLYIDWFCWDIL